MFDRTKMRRVTAAVIMVDGRLLIAQRPVHDNLSGLWELPGGKVEDGETPEQCLGRELKEELGISAEVAECVGRSVYEYGHGAIELLAYRTKWLNGALVPTFHARVLFVGPEELQDYSFAPADVPLIAQIVSEWSK